MPENETPIIITGGSITISLNDADFPSNGNGKRANANKKIKRVEVTGDGINFGQDTPSGKVTITIHYGNS